MEREGRKNDRVEKNQAFLAGLTKGLTKGIMLAPEKKRLKV